MPALTRGISKSNSRYFLCCAVALALWPPLIFAENASAEPENLKTVELETIVAPDTVITLQREGCENRCAVYRVIIFADGTFIYDGQYYVRKSGVVLGTIKTTAVQELVDAFNAIDYFHMKDEYGYKDDGECTSMLSDAPIAMTSLVTGGKSKGIIHHHRCVGHASEQLTQLEDKIDKITNTHRWIK